MNNNEKELMQQYARKVIDKGFSVPAIFFLEMFKYLSFIFSQSMIVAGPLATVFIDRQKYYKISDILSERDNVEYFICQIESNQEK
tara:strand:+ start:389 stop:646 length:258 start_codon:yes stop_codon:yes gene_type:complete